MRHELWIGDLRYDECTFDTEWDSKHEMNDGMRFNVSFESKRWRYCDLAQESCLSLTVYLCKLGGGGKEDQSVEEEFHKILRELAEQISIVLVSHDLGFVSGWLEHVLCVNRSVHMHPTASIDGKKLNEIFGDNIVAIRHDHDCPPGEHIHHHGEECDHGK